MESIFYPCHIKGDSVFDIHSCCVPFYMASLKKKYTWDMSYHESRELVDGGGLS